MNVAHARTEAAVTYKNRQDALDKHVRIQSVAHTLLSRLIDGAHDDLVLGALYGAMASRTRPVHRVPNASDAVKDSARRAVALSIAAVHSDFEWACRDLVTEALEFWEPRWTPFLQGVQPPPTRTGPLGKRGWLGTVSEVLRTRSADLGFVETCYSILGVAADDKVLARLPVFDFFRRCRNRILHQDGTAGADLVAFAQSRPLEVAFKSLPESVRRMTPTLPKIDPTSTIELKPEHAILFLVVSRTLFHGLAATIQPHLDKDGYLRMVALYAYGVPTHPFRSKCQKNVEQQARRFLRERYNVIGVKKEPLIADFKRLALWDAMVTRYHQLLALG